MEANEIKTALASAVEDVLETMCFTTVLSSEQGTVPRGVDGGALAITAALRFHGCPSGGFRVSVPQTLARVLGAGFLGVDESEVSDAQAGDVVCELANMICGSVLSRLESETTFRITHPELIPAEPGFEGPSTCGRFDLGDGVLTASLQLQQAI